MSAREGRGLWGPHLVSAAVLLVAGAVVVMPSRAEKPVRTRVTIRT